MEVLHENYGRFLAGISHMIFADSHLHKNVNKNPSYTSSIYQVIPEDGNLKELISEGDYIYIYI